MNLERGPRGAVPGQTAAIAVWRDKRERTNLPPRIVTPAKPALELVSMTSSPTGP